MVSLPVKAWLTLLRPLQWLKNLMLFFPPFLGGEILAAGFLSNAILPVLSFCSASSASYILNDLFDRDNDRHHPEKRHRPVASGRIPLRSASMLAAFLAFCACIMAWSVSLPFLAYLVAYLLLSIAYSTYLKSMVLLDIFCISSGFLIRLQAGGAAFGIQISEWLFLSVFLLSIFLSTGKRLSEKQRLGDSAKHHRKALAAYPKEFLEGTIYMTGGAVLVTYTMYVLSRNSSVLIYSVPLSCFGLFRYILRVQSGKGGDPTESLTRDFPLLIVGVAWVVMVGWGIYG